MTKGDNRYIGEEKEISITRYLGDVILDSMKLIDICINYTFSYSDKLQQMCEKKPQTEISFAPYYTKHSMTPSTQSVIIWKLTLLSK